MKKLKKKQIRKLKEYIETQTTYNEWVKETQNIEEFKKHETSKVL